METLDEQLDAANARLTEQSEKLAALETEIATLQATNEELSDNLTHTKEQLASVEGAYRKALEEVQQLEDLGKNPALLAAVINQLTKENEESGVNIVPSGRVSDTLYDIRKLLEYADPTDMQNLFHAVFSEIRFNWKDNVLDFRYKVPELQPQA